ncbi:hypothetical protein LTR36_003276 [Oleoguttula mirabilis]|uniref:Uncharacterized protein n=1 Tax=Oleoguttula mirabilis TaxID=1507867 RepID=A0AAV9JY79_9PEZI|nr:hypothetical protein LTR36_003276 [Oleoguttula mirabilis]
MCRPFGTSSSSSGNAGVHPEPQESSTVAKATTGQTHVQDDISTTPMQGAGPGYPSPNGLPFAGGAAPSASFNLPDSVHVSQPVSDTGTCSTETIKDRLLSLPGDEDDHWQPGEYAPPTDEDVDLPADVHGRLEGFAIVLRDQRAFGYINAEIRQIIWRAVVNANHFWQDPSTGKAFADPVAFARLTTSPLKDLAAQAAAKADRCGTVEAGRAWKEAVEVELRDVCFPRIREKGMGLALAHLAFLLIADEAVGNVLTCVEMQDRIDLAFAGATEMEWSGLQYFTRRLFNGMGSRYLDAVERIWFANFTTAC